MPPDAGQTVSRNSRERGGPAGVGQRFTPSLAAEASTQAHKAYLWDAIAQTEAVASHLFIPPHPKGERSVAAGLAPGFLIVATGVKGLEYQLTKKGSCSPPPEITRK